MTLLAIDWVGVGVKTGQFILSFSILVVLHEMGHFIPARLFKCRVEKFYLFFNPWFSLWKKKVGDTEYGIGWVPFGGFVKISGMIDESMDKEQMKLPPEPYEFRAKPAWQRLIIMVGGVIVNVLLAIIIFIGITWVWGEDNLPIKNMRYGVHTDSLARSIGLRDGDNIVGFNGKPVENFSVLESDVMFKNVKTLQVFRDGQNVDINVPEDFSKKIDKKKMGSLVNPRFPVIIDSVPKTTGFIEGRLQKGDKLVAQNNVPFDWFHEYEQLRKGKADSTVVLTVLRGTDTVNVSLKVNHKGAYGFYYSTPAALFGLVHKEYSLIEAIPHGYSQCWETLSKYITGLKRLFNGDDKPSESLGSVVSIANTFPSVWDWERFWTLTGIFSIILAFMNILPIPALDGGHALFTIYEMITGRKPGDKFMEYAQMAGMILLLGLMAYALGLDFWRIFKK